MQRLIGRHLGSRPLVAACAFGLYLVSTPHAALAAGSAMAPAPPTNCTPDVATATVSCSFAYTGSEQTFTVPPGISTVSVVVIGAAGGSGNGIGPILGGRGGRVDGVLGGLTPGQSLYVEVGQAPNTATTGELVDTPAFNGGGAPGAGSFSGGGGGGSDIRTVSSSASGTLASRLIVAGGGGGAAESYEGQPQPGGDAGGAAGANGTPAAPSGYSGAGGAGGTQTAGGVGGAPGTGGRAGHAGSLGQGGAGTAGIPSAGGGGGGYYGGGGGSGASYEGNPGPGVAGSGGGGSSLVPAGGHFEATTAPASVTITYGVGLAPMVTKQPSDQAVVSGASATFSADASGTPSPTVQWQSAPPGSTTFTDVAGATTTTYTTPATSPANDGTKFRAVFTNVVSSVTTDTARLTVTSPASGAAPSFGTAATLPTARQNQPYRTTIEISGDPAPTSSVVSGALPPGLGFSDGVVTGTPTTAGRYSFTVRATNASGSANRTFTITVDAVHTLPMTGAPIAALSETGLGALVLGALLCVAAPRRKPCGKRSGRR